MNLPSISKEKRISLTFPALNDTPNYYTGICAATLVYGIFPKIAGDTAPKTMTKRGESIG